MSAKRALHPWRSADDLMAWYGTRRWAGKAVVAYVVWVMTWTIVGIVRFPQGSPNERAFTLPFLLATLGPIVAALSPLLVIAWRHKPRGR